MIVLLGLLAPRLLPAQTAQAPNVIIILADDLGYADVGFNGCKDIPTPNIDRIAQNGMVCKQGYVSYAVCGPSRAGIMTGRYQDRFGFNRNPLLAPNDPDMGLALSEETMGAYLQRAHYTTMAIGKWHLGAHQSLRPNKRGFDEFFGFLSGGHRYLPSDWTLNDLSEAKSQYDGYKTKLLRNNQRVEEQEYITDAFSREAVSFIERNREHPFFLYLAYNAPHTPLEATEKYLSRFSQIKDKKRRTYAAMVSAMDDGIGRVLDKLNELNLDKNTIVFFLSDNGGPIHANASNNAPLRGEKSDFFEGGIRVPFAVQWTGVIPAGTEYTRPVISLDIFASMAAMLPVKPKNKLDGVNILPYLRGQKKGDPHTYLFWRNFDRQRYAVVGPAFKRIDEKGKKSMLFNLRNDLSEKNDLSDQDPGQMKSLEKQIRKWNKILMNPVFLGLLEDEQYSKTHPERWMVTDNK